MTVIAILTTVTLLVAHFKYGLFDSEIYQVADIKREVYSMEYFSETKNLKTKTTFASGEEANSEQIIDTNFVVLLRDKKEIKDTLSKTVYINNGYLVILDSKVKANGEEAELDSLNIFDEKIIKEFESNPKGLKYLFAEFAFYEDGTILNIKLPKDIDLYNVEKLLDLIKGVIPKLSRNKTEDEENGIKIKTKNRNCKKTKLFSQYELPKEFVDKYSKSRFKGSKISRLVQTDIEDDKISEIRTNTNVYLETQTDGEELNESNIFGIQGLKVEVNSKIFKE